MGPVRVCQRPSAGGIGMDRWRTRIKGIMRTRAGRATYRVLIVSDERQFRESVRTALSASGYHVTTCCQAASAWEAFRLHTFDLAMVARVLPGDMTSLQLISQLRQWRKELPIIMTAATASLQDRVTGLDAGADQYLLEPIAMAELEARIRALLRASVTPIHIGPLSFVPGDPRVRLGDQPVELPGRELSLLEALGARVGSVVSRDTISSRLCKGFEPVSASTIEVSMHRLRRRLAPFGLQIRTVRGFGYVLENPATRSWERLPVR